MITNYFRPQSLAEALELLSQSDTCPLGGGTWLNQARDEKYNVVDLQSLGLDQIRKTGNNLEIDACVTLQQLSDSPDCPPALRHAIWQEAGLNIRNAATVAGTLVTCDGRSSFATVMLALDARLTITSAQGSTSSGLGEFLPLRSRALITTINIPLNARVSFESVARTPMDKPIVCAALAQWSSGRTRLALGGCHSAPVMAMDGTEPGGLEHAARSAYHESGDQWATGEYRAELAATLAKRCLDSVSN